MIHIIVISCKRLLKKRIYPSQILSDVKTMSDVFSYELVLDHNKKKPKYHAKYICGATVAKKPLETKIQNTYRPN